MKALFLLAAGAGLAVTAFAHLRAGVEDLKPGDPAPPFSLTGSDGQTYRLADFLGKRAVVLAWFPRAFTGG